MGRTHVDTPRKHFLDLTSSERSQAAAQILFRAGYTDLEWGADSDHDWVTNFPAREDFETNRLKGLAADEGVVHLCTFRNVEGRQLLALVHVLQARGHLLVETIGFR